MDKTRVLIADDDYFFRQLLTKVFDEYECSVKTVNNGEECLLSLFYDTPDLAVVDYHLPGVKGDMIISNTRMHNILLPIIVVTADNSLDAERSIRKQGPAFFLTKPFKVNDLRAIYEKIAANL